MFREIREVKKMEKLSDKAVKQANFGYMQIKPETNMTHEEAVEFIESLFKI